MLIKTGVGEIIDVIKDAEHNIDDDGTKEALVRAKKQAEEEVKETELKSEN